MADSMEERNRGSERSRRSEAAGGDVRGGESGPGGDVRAGGPGAGEGLRTGESGPAADLRGRDVRAGQSGAGEEVRRGQSGPTAGLSALDLPATGLPAPDLPAGDAPAQEPEAAGGLAGVLAGLSGGRRAAVLLDLVREETAGLAGTDPLDIDPEMAYRDYGYNSLAAVELTGRLSQATGLELPLTLLFDHPTAAAVAQHLLGLFGFAPSDEDTSEAEASDADPDLGHGDDPIAVVGMACRFPGGVTSPDGLWDLVAAGRDAVSDFPRDRGWDLDGLYSADPEQPGTSYARTGGFLDPVADFDAEFFGIARREALAMDPQQRLLLQTVWESLENAGIDPGRLKKSRTGVYMGSSGQDYENVARSGPGELEGYWGIGSAGSVLSGRVAYAFGFEGPALTVDTACSSSLVGMHLAVQALRRGECTLAVAGGATVMATPKVFTEFSRQRALSPDGRCRSYAQAADGTGWAEGIGVLLLERLSEARRNNHRVLALIPGTAVNQDGASNGLTAPNGGAQQRVIAQALADAGLRAQDVDAVEGHGTGTTLGDPIEVDALAAVFGKDRPADRPLRLGSLKSNIGHSQAAAGVGGLIKMIQALRHEVLPRTLHVDRPTPKADWSGDVVSLLTEATPWPRGERVRRAGVSAFGVGGTNAHVLVEEAPSAERAATATPEEQVPHLELPASSASFETNRAVPWVLSAKTPAALHAQARRLHTHLTTTQPHATPTQIGAALAHTRTHFDHRATLTGTTRTELLAGLAEFARGGEADQAPLARSLTPTLARARARAGKTVFVFPGQGSQWIGMSRELVAAHPVFAQELSACAQALAPYTDFSLDDVLSGAPGAPPLDRVDVVQPALFAVMAALAALWRHHGVQPDAVVGHSQGEIAAAYVAGGLSLQDAARVVALRSRAIAEMAGRGGMASVTASPERLLPLLEDFDGLISVAAVNGPSSMTVSGDSDALDGLLARCDAEGIWARRVPVDYASHSPQVESLRERLAEVLAPVAPRSGEVRFHSTVTAGEFDTRGLDADYWYRNLRRTVRFEEVVRALLDQGHTTFIEVSPHPILTFAVEQTVEGAGQGNGGTGQGAAAVLGSARREQELAQFTASLAAAHAHGAPVDWDAVFDPAVARDVELPTYAFESTRYWAAPRPVAGDVGEAGLHSTGHRLLTAGAELADEGGWLFTGRISRDTHGWLEDHAVYGTVLLPGTAFVDMAVLAASYVDCDVVEELTLEEPLVLPDEGATDLQASVGAPDARGRRPVAVHSRPAGAAGDEWTRHASGFLAPAPARGEASPELVSWPPSGADPLDVDGLYDRLTDRGFEYGPLFRGLRAAWRRDGVLLAEVDTATAGGAEGYGVHPALLDAAFHAQLTELADADGASGQAWLPFTWSGVRVVQPGATHLRVSLTPLGEGTVRMSAVDASGAPVVTVDSVVARPVSQSHLSGTRAPADSLFRVAWQPIPTPPLTPATVQERWAILSEDERTLAHPDATIGSGAGAEAGAEPGPDAGAAANTEPGPDAEADANVEPGPNARADASAEPGPNPGADTNTEPGPNPGADTNTNTAPGAGTDSATGAVLGPRTGPDSNTGSHIPTGTPAAPQLPAAPHLPATSHTPTYPTLPHLATALDAGDPVPDTVIAFVPAAHGAPTAEAARSLAQQTLALLRGWLGDARFSGARLVLVTRGAVAVEPGETVAPDLAPLWGLVRTAQSEHPGRFTLVDLAGDSGDDPARDLAGDADGDPAHVLSVALAADEPQVAVRDGVLHIPRAVRVRGASGGPLPFDPDGTVLITGGTSGLGAQLARHLVAERGARHLLLASRRGPDAEGVTELLGELVGLGAEVTVAACDVTDRAATAALLAAVDAAHPLTAVVHSAGALDDGLLEALTPERLDRVLRPKVDAALHLHELTESAPLAAFVLFSSVAGTIGGPGQGNYAAANTFLDSFAQWRRAQGLPALSLAWGLWEEASDMTRHLGDAEVAQLGRSGLAPLATEEGLRLFDSVHGTADALLLPARLDLGALRAQAREGSLPAVLRSLVPAAQGLADRPGAALPARFAATAAEERDALVLTAVAAEVAAVLGYEDTGAVDVERPFKELGLDSLGAVRLRNRLSQVTGLTLPSTLVFGHPTVPALAAHLRTLLDEHTAGGQEAATPAVWLDLDRLAGLLPSVADADVAAVRTRLRSLLAALDDRGGGQDGGAGALRREHIDEASAQDLFDLIDNDLGVG
ncbi:SDR family NAD(P)-dependent oxidoreductase [Streptomyces sp. NPDC057302]|uniref:type I polyketide synthase n=1 Tax=Streptomyces sp. NPDC057302 TaxID=3346094 RepID=UPI00362B051C